MCSLEENREQVDTELFCGSIKSFNTRRGFGFLSCEDTALRFGRDVYLSKEEAMMLAAEPAVGLTDQSKAPPVVEGDILLFQVKLSVEGFPQAVQARKIRRLRGVVQQAPSSVADGIVIVNGDGSDGAEALSHNPDAALNQLLGAEVRLRPSECGQLQLMPNDEVAFCCVNVPDSEGPALGAQLIELLSTSRVAGSMLGCFSLQLPAIASSDATETTDDGTAIVELHGHALTDCICISGLPLDFVVPDLMRLFSKLGGKEAKWKPANGNDKLGSACIPFSGPEQVAKFLAHATHTISEGGITQLAHVGPCLQRRCGSGLCPCASDPVESVATGSGTQAAPSTAGWDFHHVTGRTSHADHEAKQVALQSSICGPSMVLEATSAVPIPPTRAASYNPTTNWRCAHGSIVVPTEAPEMLLASEDRCSVCIRWPTVIHASAYVVELLDQGTMTAQRFMRVTSEGVALPALMDLRLDGLQPCGMYTACVRCVAPCGCESACSPWACLALGSVVPPNVVPWTSALHHALPSNAAPAVLLGVVPHSCPAPPSAPPSFPLAATTQALMLAPIPEAEETMDALANCSDDILTLD